MAWFGNCVATGSAVNAPPAGNKAVSKFTPDFDGTLTSVVFNATSHNTGSRAVIYDASGTGGAPGALLGVSTELATTPSGATWNKYTFTPGVSITVAGGPYWIGIWSAATSSPTSSCATLTGGIDFNANTYSTLGNPSNPFGTPSTANFVYPEVGVYDPGFITTAPNSYRGYPSAADPSTGFGGGLPTANGLAVLSVAAQGTIDSISWLNPLAGTGHVRAVIYDNSGTSGAPRTLLGTSNQITAPVAGLNTATFTPGINVSGTVYIGLHVDNALTGVTGPAIGGVASYTGGATYSSGTPSTFPSPTLQSGAWNIWANSISGFITTQAIFGRIGARSYSSGYVTISTGALLLGGRVAATSQARGSLTPRASLGGRINAASSATAWLPSSITVGGSIKTMSRGQLLQRNSILVTSRITAQSKMRGLMYLQTGTLRAQWGTIINTG